MFFILCLCTSPVTLFGQDDEDDEGTFWEDEEDFDETLLSITRMTNTMKMTSTMMKKTLLILNIAMKTLQNLSKMTMSMERMRMRKTI
jgi:hypothetical protein